MTKAMFLLLCVLTCCSSESARLARGFEAPGGFAGSDPGGASSGGTSGAAGAPAGGVLVTGGTGGASSGGLPATGGTATGGTQPTGGTGGDDQPQNPCSGLCAAASAVELGWLAYDALGRPYLTIPPTAACAWVSTGQLGRTVGAWTCQAFGARQVSLNGSMAPECTGAVAPVAPPPQQPEILSGGYCVQVTAGSETGVMVFGGA